MDTYWKAAFREQMKTNGVTYGKLAAALGMSLPGVKKVFQKGDISLERFNHICRVLELDPADLIRQGSQNGLKVKSLSQRANNFFNREAQAFLLYYLLTVEKLKLDEAARTLKLSQSECYRFLRQLDQLGLVRWDEGDKVVLPDKAPFLFDRNSSCAVKFAKRIAQAMIDAEFAKKQSQHSHISLRQIAVPKGQLGVVCQKMKELSDELYRNFPYKGRDHSRANDLIPLRVLFCQSPDIGIMTE